MMGGAHISSNHHLLLTPLRLRPKKFENTTRHMCRSPQQKRAKHEEWISVDTRRKLDVRKEKKAVLNASLKIAANAKALEDNTQL